MAVDVVLLSARTARSNAYAQAIARRGLRLAAALVYGDDRPQAGQAPADVLPGLIAGAQASSWLPDLTQPLNQSLEAVCDRVIPVAAAHVNDPPVREQLAALQPALVVFSGYGSQIVSAEVLALAPFLHVHAGSLPAFRGSTTVYYELLQTGQCGVSALLLESTIDTGPILARKRYPRPPAGVDIDYLYDPAIRADLLADVLATRQRLGHLPPPEPQRPEDGQTYYVIHPVLKHLAVLGTQATDGGKDADHLS